VRDRWRACGVPFLVLLGTLATVAEPRAGTNLEPAVRVETQDTADADVRETEHLSIRWVRGVSPEAVEAVAEQGEVFYAAIRGLLGVEPPRRIPIVLQGPAESPERESRGYPHVDFFARIHLFQYGGQDSSYLSALAHEMVHVFRFDRHEEIDWFFEEGFAELVALTVDPSLRGFPWYETPVEIAAGQWIASGEDLSLQEMRSRHRELNLPCRAQVYTLRAAFFRHLADRHGLGTVLEIARRRPAGTLADYEESFGQSLSALEAEWRDALLQQYRSTADAEVRARHYRERTPIRYMSVCGGGSGSPD
jgi:hypothetical protein